MHRRSLLKGMAAVIALQPDLLSRLAANAATAPRSAACGPATPRWPNAESWAKLNEAVGGNLIAAASPVRRLRDRSQGRIMRGRAREHPQSVLPRRPARRHAGLRLARCMDAGAQRLRGEGAIERRRRGGGEFRARQSSSPRRERRRPQLSGHFERARLAADLDARDERGDAARRLHAARRRRQGGALPAVTAGAGAVWIDLYHAVTSEAGRYVQGGGCTDVGVAGLVQSGGFGSFSKGFGTAAAGLLEAEIVTADGAVRDRERLHQSGPVLGAQGRRRRELGRGHAAHAAHP